MIPFKATQRFSRLGCIKLESFQVGLVAPFHSLARKGQQVDNGTVPLNHGCRHLFTDDSLGIEKYIIQRQKASIQYENFADQFREKMKEVLESPGQQLIFTEDLKNIIYLAESNEADMSLVIEMTKKFCSQHSGLRFGGYKFGPTLMRMFYHLNQTDLMLQAMKMKEFEGFFDQTACYHIAMDLAYEAGRYDDVLTLFEDLKEKRIHGKKYHKNCATIAFAALYRLNTEESYKKSKTLVTALEEHGSKLNIRMILFSAGLALKQNDLHTCMELIGTTRQNHNKVNIVIKNLKILSLIGMGRVEDTLPVLRALLQVDLPDTHQRQRHMIFKETIDRLESAIMYTENRELIAEFKHIYKNLEAYDFINTTETLDDLICRPIDPFTPREHQPRHQALLSASFNRNAMHQNRRPGSTYRQGLAEME